MLFITLFGFAAGLIGLRSATAGKRRALILLILASAAQFGALLLAVPLPWQRYVMPLVPVAALWAGVGSANLVSLVMKSLPAIQNRAGR